MRWLKHVLNWKGGRADSLPAAAAVSQQQDWLALGNRALADGNMPEAARCYASGVEQHPDLGPLRIGYAFALLEQGNARDALVHLRHAVSLPDPASVHLHDAHFLLGRAYAGTGQLQEAFLSFAEAARLKEDFLEAVAEAADMLERLGHHEQAVSWLQRLNASQPDGGTLLRMSVLLLRAGQPERALVYSEQAMAQRPTDLQASMIRFEALLALQRPQEALREADRAMELAGRLPALLVNRSVVLGRLARLDEAQACLDEALALEPHRRDAWVNRVSMLLQQVRVPETIAAARQALRLLPDDPDIHWNLALALLMHGDYREGWIESEWRRRSAAFMHKTLAVDAPEWRGEDLAGRTIFLHAEQGFGDTIQFARFVPRVARLARKVWLLVPSVLESLLAPALPPNCSILPQGSRLPPIDFHCPLLSVAAALQVTLEDLPGPVPYLSAPSPRVAQWKARIGSRALNVGIVWAGNPRHVNDHNRSLPLNRFRQLDVEGCRFFTVQPDLRPSDRDALAQWGRALDLGRELGTFEDSAALVQALDLVITVDTSIAHLAGALGKPVWILVPHCPDWRWLLDREDSPWYPSARLFRQATPGDWDGVIDRVRRQLQALALTAPA